MVPPDGGSRILFFSGGTALAPVAAELSRHTRNAVHVITTFDSGGSSAELRRALDMPAVGDIRARIMALADRSLEGNPETVELLGYRLPKDAGPEALHRELASLASGAHPLVAAIPEPMNEVVTQHLSAFRSLMPVDMDLAGASIGNLILTSGYLSLDRQLEPVVRVFSGMVQARGVVMPVADSCAHLCVRLENGEVIVGQHRFTGKTATSITSPILDMWLSASLDDPSPVSVPIQSRLAHVIRTADLICYPVGSFFSSVMANLLPLGVSCAVREAACPKVFIPAWTRSFSGSRCRIRWRICCVSEPTAARRGRRSTGFLWTRTSPAIPAASPTSGLPGSASVSARRILFPSLPISTRACCAASFWVTGSRERKLGKGGRTFLKNPHKGGKSGFSLPSPKPIPPSPKTFGVIGSLFGKVLKAKAWACLSVFGERGCLGRENIP